MALAKNRTIAGRQMRWIQFSCLVGLGVLLWLVFVLYGRREQAEGAFGSAMPLSAPLPQHPRIQAYFNHSQSNQYQEPYRDQYRAGDDLEQVILDQLNQAQASIDIAVQELNLPRIAHTLVAKYREGVRVRVIVENDYRQPWSTLSQTEIRDLAERDRRKYDEFLQLVDANQDGQVQSNEAIQRDAMRILDLGQIPLIDDTADGSKGSGLMHHKFVVVDNQVVVTGSANFTTSGVHGDFLNSDSRGNANHVVVIDDGAIAQLLTDEFDLMWGDGPGGKTDSLFGLQKPYRPPQDVFIDSDTSITVQFSPVSGDRHPWENSANGLIQRTLQLAQQRIDLALFVFSE